MHKSRASAVCTWLCWHFSVASAEDQGKANELCFIPDVTSRESLNCCHTNPLKTRFQKMLTISIILL